MNHSITVMRNGTLIYDITDVQEVPAIGDQLDLTDIGDDAGMYTVMGRTWDLAARSCELDVELTSLVE